MMWHLTCYWGSCLEVVPPHSRVEGRTWEFILDLPGTVKAGSPKRTQRKNTLGTPTKKPKSSKQLDPAELTAKREPRSEYDRQRRKTPDRLECRRIRAREERQRAKDRGLCRDCRQPAIPDQTRCPTCAEKHSESNRRWKAQRRGKNEEK